MLEKLSYDLDFNSISLMEYRSNLNIHCDIDTNGVQILRKELHT